MSADGTVLYSGGEDVLNPEPTFAERGDVFEQWLIAKRDMWIEDGPSWHTVDEILTDYRIHADHQVPLDEPTPDKRVMAYSEMSGGAA